MSESEAPPKKKDLVLVHGVTDDGSGVRVLRRREESLEAGEMRPLEQGKPIHGEVVKLTPHSECPLLFEAETQLPVNEPARRTGRSKARADRSRTGPPQVASNSYRRNWDAVWNRRKKRALMN